MTARLSSTKRELLAYVRRVAAGNEALQNGRRLERLLREELHRYVDRVCKRAVRALVAERKRHAKGGGR